MKKCLPYLLFIYVIDIKESIKTDTVGIKNKTSLRHIKNDNHRDDDCVMVDNAEIINGIEDKRQFNNNTFHLQYGNMYLTFYGDDFKFMDVPGDGDCFYHSVLEYSSIQENSMAYRI